MEKLVIKGGTPLCGEVTISGAKNAAVAIIPAAVLVDGICTIKNVPAIKDVEVICSILEDLGAEILRPDKNTLVIDCRNVNNYTPTPEKVCKMRASYYLLGSLLGRMKKATVALPGGCNFSAGKKMPDADCQEQKKKDDGRPIDLHLKGFRALGAITNSDEDIEASGVVIAEAEKLTGSTIYLDVVSVGATINIMLAAALADGVTRIQNAAKEPHVVSVAQFLNNMGAKIVGAGTDTIRITGVSRLTGREYEIIPDQIEAGTFMVAAAATGGNVLIKNVVHTHMETVTDKLREAGATVEEVNIEGTEIDNIRVIGHGKLSPVKIKTLPYPGFPTDMQPQFVSLLTAADGISAVTEGVWEARFQYVDQLCKMGAEIETDAKERTATIKGTRLTGTDVCATDLRAGAALVIAALMAEGETTISNIHYIDRGYEDMEAKFKSLGADITRIDD